MKVKAFLFNTFTLGGMLFGWIQWGGFVGIVMGYSLGMLIPWILLIMIAGGVFLGDLLSGSVTRTRIAEEIPVRVATPEEEWDAAYVRHCEDNHVRCEYYTE